MKLTESEYQAVLAKQGKGGVTRHADRHTPRKGSEAGKPAPSPSYDSKLEAQYATYLWNLKHAVEILDYVHHPFTFLLPGGVKYTPDFLVIDEPIHNGPPMYYVEIHEVKGSLKMKNARDSVTRFRIARGLYPWWTFKLIELSHGQWRQIE